MIPRVNILLYGILYTTTSRPNTNTSTITLHAELLFIWTACDIPGTKHCKGDTKEQVARHNQPNIYIYTHDK